MPPRRITTGVVTKLTGVSAKTLHGWSAGGLLNPSVSEADGTGSERVYSFADVAAVHAASLARSLGVPLPVLVPMVDCMRNAVPNEPAVDERSNTVVLVANGRAIAVENPELAALMREHDTRVVLAFEVGSIGADMLSQLTEAVLAGTLPRRKGRPPGSEGKTKRSRPSKRVERNRRR